MLIQCVPNFSEGRRADVIAAIVESIASTIGVRLVDWSADTDHNRMVVTYVGTPEAVVEATLAAAAVAISKIDLSHHKGVHPRLGAIDVVPFVPLTNIAMEDCAKAAHQFGAMLAERFGIPVFLYEKASAERRVLPTVRKKAFKDLLPDYGPSAPHPTAGATVAGARGPMIAYNIVIDVADPAAARTIARELRDGGVSGFRGVRALGLRLPSRHMTQVSVNITTPETAPLGSVYDYVLGRARELGVNVLESEVIGALPGFTAFRQIADSIRAPGLKPRQILWENWPAE